MTIPKPRFRLPRWSAPVAVLRVLPGVAAIFSCSPGPRAEPLQAEAKASALAAAPSVPGRGPSPAQAAKAQPGQALLAAGDRLKIVFLETFDTPKTKTGDGIRPGVKTFYQRLDLAGEYTIQREGTVAIPRLGTFDLASMTLADAQLAIAAAFEKVMNRHCEVTIAVVERQPVYILGSVRNPGAYKCVPGMTVLHAVAVAGGMGGGREQSARLVELLRARNGTAVLRDNLIKALAGQARLKAERGGSARPELPARLVEIAGKERAEALIAAEAARLEYERLAHREEAAKRARDIERMKQEIPLLEARLASVSGQIEKRNKRVNMLREAGSAVLAATLNAAETDKAGLELKQQETILAMGRAKQDLVQLERTDILRQREYEAGLVREIAANDAEIERLEKELRLSSAIASVMEDSVERRPAVSHGQPRVEIVREVKGTPLFIEARETSRLEPGDVVVVKAGAPRADEASSAFAGSPWGAF